MNIWPCYLFLLLWWYPYPKTAVLPTPPPWSDYRNLRCIFLEYSVIFDELSLGQGVKGAQGAAVIHNNSEVHYVHDLTGISSTELRNTDDIEVL